MAGSKMAGRIIRGALIGAVLGLLVGVALSGAMYMYNYMREESENGKVAGVEEVSLQAEGAEYAPTLNVSGRVKKVYDSKELENILKDGGITGLAREAAAGNWYNGGEETVAGNEDNGSEETVAEKGDNGGEETVAGNGDNGSDGTWKVANTEEGSQQDTLGDSMLRFHVRANSNSDVDIALKYQVRDAVIEVIEEGLKACTTLDEAKAYLYQNLDLVEGTALDTLSAQGYNYTVQVYLSNDYFPMRQYGDIVLPAGYYEALRVDIGLANGENFWCLLYPTMCVPVEAGGVITKDGQQELKEALTPEQYDKLFVKKEVPEDDIEIRFKLWEMIFK